MTFSHVESLAAVRMTALGAARPTLKSCRSSPVVFTIVVTFEALLWNDDVTKESLLEGNQGIFYARKPKCTGAQPGSFARYIGSAPA
jgi:hypothetical protein